MFILFATDNKMYFDSAEEIVIALGNVDGESSGRFEEMHWNGK
jgi:hypothetical protein